MQKLSDCLMLTYSMTVIYVFFSAVTVESSRLKYNVFLSILLILKKANKLGEARTCDINAEFIPSLLMAIIVGQTQHGRSLVWPGSMSLMN
jgi:hypothetical protein